MRLVAMALLAAFSLANAQVATDKPLAKKDDKAKEAKEAKEAEKAKPPPRPRVILNKEGAGNDAAGGRGVGESSMGGTPGTPSGSFTRP